MVGDAGRGFEVARPHLVADVVVVEGGAVGCMLASRPSENRSLRVVLIEAGRDTPADAPPDDIADVFARSYANPDYLAASSDLLERA
jgi:choline dehydrogenase-like flavoprotein